MDAGAMIILLLIGGVGIWILTEVVKSIKNKTRTYEDNIDIIRRNVQLFGWLYGIIPLFVGLLWFVDWIVKQYK